MAEVAIREAAPRDHARLLAEEGRRGSLSSRRVVAAARARRARLAHRPIVTPLPPGPQRSARCELHDWSLPVTGPEVLERAERARKEASELRHESLLLRDAMGWRLRRLRRTQRLAADPLGLVWHEGPDGLDDIIV